MFDFALERAPNSEQKSAVKSIAFFIFFSLSVLASIPASAVSEVGFAEAIHNKVLPFIKCHLVRSSFQSFDNKRIQFATLRTSNSRGTIFLSPGRTESIIGFSEVIYDLSQAGYSVAILDHRGQGESERLVPHSDVSFVNDFHDYARDFETFVERASRLALPQPYFLLGTSMGSTIATFYLIDHPNVFRQAVFAVPMYGIKTSWFPESIAGDVLAALDWAGRAADFAPSQSSYDAAQDFVGNVFTHSQSRFYLDVELTKANPQIATGGASVRWVEQSIAAASELQSKADKVLTPLLIIQAGNDQVVDNDAETAFCGRAKRCRLTAHLESNHWMLMEKDSIRNSVLVEALAFFENL